MLTSEKINPTTYPGHLLHRVLLGAGLGLAVISFFLLMVKNPDPSWPKHWMIRPLVIVPLAVAGAGLCFHFLDKYRYEKGWNKILITLLGIIGHLIALWLGMVVGLDGTLWN
ncbi:potassium transporter KefB [Sediminibacterium goheungense]|uniref:Potassium transporter KefB n=1 Tax=Sediminibacterium goheungense TaxID=1086393 RepID=A0A4R6ITI4_9BACT|nr:potassium transporter KefB [Sediminibacterium goheungense]TDO25850.1 hypothetical protein BC659_2774 [Sediminibacterium goheungense]